MEAPGSCGASALSRLLVVASVDHVRVAPGMVELWSVIRPDGDTRASDRGRCGLALCTLFGVGAAQKAGSVGVGRGMDQSASGSVGLGVSV